MRKIICPRCHSSHVVMIDSTRSNPSRKTRTDEISGTRIMANLMTVGLLLPVVGVHKKRRNAHEWLCLDCNTQFTR